jgi:formyl-CoA transferase
MMETLLDGLVVLDLSRVLAGPFAGMMLADMGADVIKIETPGKGDDSRQFAPMLNGESCYYMNLNRNKRGMTLNLKSDDGKEVFRRLVKKADVVLENFRPGVMDRLGLGYDTLRELNPKLVYACVSGFGQYGPYSQRGGYDIIGQAMGGLMSTTGWPESGPTRTGTAMSDVLAGLSVTAGILGALHNAQRTGKGQKVDVALVDSTVASLEIINQIYLATGKVPERIGNRYESVYPYDSFRCANGELVIACGNDKLFAKLAELMDRPELAHDTLFETNPKRVQNHAALKPIVEDWAMGYERDALVGLLLENGVPCGPINTIADTVNDPHIAGAREMFVEVEHPKAGKMRLTGSHIKFSRTKAGIRTPAPLLGQHTAELLAELGYSDAEADQLRENGAF